MGLFDTMFAPGGVAPDQGWLSRLLQQQGGDPRDGMFGGPGLSQSAMGGGAGGGVFNAPPAAMQAFAQAPQQPPPQPAPQQMQPYAPQSEPGAGDRLMAGASNFSDPRLGLIGRLANSVQGLSTGQRTDPQGISQAQQQGLYQALRQKGMDHATALAAMSSPEIMKESALFKTPRFVPNVGNDQFGQPQPGFVDERNQTAIRAQLGGQPSAVGSGDPSVTGKDFLATLDKPVASQVQAMLDGRMAPPTSMAAKSPYWQRMLQYAGQVEPDFDLTKWQQRQSGNKDFYGGGKSSEMVRAANQTIHHVGELIGSMDKLNNGQYPMLNTVGNTINTSVLGKGAVTEFLPNAHAVAEEMSKVFKGANLSDAEIHQWEKSLNENMSPEQQRASVGKLMTLLNGSLSALETKRRSSLGDNLSDQKGPLLDKDSQHTLEKVNSWIKGDAPVQPASAAPSAQPQTATGPNGQKLMLKGNQWVPMR